MCSPKEVMLWWIGRCISSDPLSPALQAGHLLQEVSPHAELPPMFCGPLASKGKAKATVIHLLSLGPGRQVAPCPVTNQCSFTYRILETTPHFYPPPGNSRGSGRGSGPLGLAMCLACTALCTPLLAHRALGHQLLCRENTGVHAVLGLPP